MQDETNEQAASGKGASGESGASELTFEQAIEQLEQLIEKIESGEVGLEQALKHYEEGTELIKRCRGILDSAEKRIGELTEGGGGELEVSESDEGEGEG
jgi:exodeoxyribonuclease VII small subunit